MGKSGKSPIAVGLMHRLPNLMTVLDYVYVFQLWPRNVQMSPSSPVCSLVTGWHHFTTNIYFFINPNIPLTNPPISVPRIRCATKRPNLSLCGFQPYNHLTILQKSRHGFEVGLGWGPVFWTIRQKFCSFLQMAPKWYFRRPLHPNFDQIYITPSA